jgi:hypothetical protein
MSPRWLAVFGSLLLLGMVVELVRRRSLKEEYSLLWIITALVLLGLSIWFGLLVSITRAIGAIAPSSTLFFFGLVFALLMLLHFSVRVSLLERTVTALVQELGLLSAQRENGFAGAQSEAAAVMDEAGANGAPAARGGGASLSKTAERADR